MTSTVPTILFDTSRHVSRISIPLIVYTRYHDMWSPKLSFFHLLPHCFSNHFSFYPKQSVHPYEHVYIAYVNQIKKLDDGTILNSSELVSIAWQ